MQRVTMRSWDFLNVHNFDDFKLKYFVSFLFRFIFELESYAGTAYKNANVRESSRSEEQQMSLYTSVMLWAGVPKPGEDISP